MTMSLRAPSEVGNFFLGWTTVSFQWQILLHGVSCNYHSGILHAAPEFRTRQHPSVFLCSPTTSASYSADPWVDSQNMREYLQMRISLVSFSLSWHMPRCLLNARQEPLDTFKKLHCSQQSSSSHAMLCTREISVVETMKIHPSP